MLAVASGLCRHVLCFRTVWEATHAKLGLAPSQDTGRIAAHLSAAGLPTRLAEIPGDLELVYDGRSEFCVRALAWLLAQGPDIVPIPGSKRRTQPAVTQLPLANGCASCLRAGPPPTPA